MFYGFALLSTFLTFVDFISSVHAYLTFQCVRELSKLVEIAALWKEKYFVTSCIPSYLHVFLQLVKSASICVATYTFENHILSHMF